MPKQLMLFMRGVTRRMWCHAIWRITTRGNYLLVRRLDDLRV
ncbi:hypothetical protein [Methyloglobulus sp.]